MVWRRWGLFWVRTSNDSYWLFRSHCGLELPKPNRKTNKCVREHLRLSLPRDLSDYEIDRISDIEKPNDDTVADISFHSKNFQPAKHSLVVKLRTKVCG